MAGEVCVTPLPLIVIKDRFGLARVFVIIENLELKVLYIAIYAGKVFE